MDRGYHAIHAFPNNDAGRRPSSRHAGYHLPMLGQLDHEERLRLMKFVCSFAWADLEIQAEERAMVSKMIEKLQLEDERKEVMAWLRHPPPIEEIDPTLVPRDHRALFLRAVEEIIGADDVVDPNEAETFELFKMLLT